MSPGAPKFAKLSQKAFAKPALFLPVHSSRRRRACALLDSGLKAGVCLAFSRQGRGGSKGRRAGGEGKETKRELLAGGGKRKERSPGGSLLSSPEGEREREKRNSDRRDPSREVDQAGARWSFPRACPASGGTVA